MESTRTWSAPTVMVPRAPGLGVGRPVCFQPGCGVAETTRVVATQALPARRGFESCSTRSMIGSQHPSPTCSSSSPLADTVTSRVCPTHSPTKGLNDPADAVGAGVLVVVVVPADVPADVVAVGAAELVTVTVTVLVLTFTADAEAVADVAGDEVAATGCMPLVEPLPQAAVPAPTRATTRIT